MGEEEFRVFYDRTARPLKAYLFRMAGDPALADDLHQESYLRLLQSSLPADASDEHRKNYLFRIATNLMRDYTRRRRPEALDEAKAGYAAQHTDDPDVQRVLNRLPQKQRELLWLAYVEGMNHAEIAEVVGVKSTSIRPLLARARLRFSEILEAAGIQKVSK